MYNDDPEDSPIVRHVLYTNECTSMLASFLTALLMRARPERVRAALEGALENWDATVAGAKALANLASSGEPSGWEDDPPVDPC